jgi:23S rRNA (pseudouridine1915-N3)-methyltransferase
MIRVIAIGRQRQGPEAELFARYAARLRPPLGLTELPEGRGAPVEIKRREAAALIAALPSGAFAVALDQDGATPDSPALARLLAQWQGLGRPICFLIGGTEGLDATVLARADAKLSLGRLTWPHYLARAMLAEQLFRAHSILTGHPSHRDGRP